MRFANYKYEPRHLLSIGDTVQILAIDNLYNKMGLPHDDIVYINKDELHCYNGEYVILPVSMPLLDYYKKGLSEVFSDHIIPVFLGLTILKNTLCRDEIEYLKKYEPIGCRDYRTLMLMRKNGIDSYLFGCITITLPTREEKNYSDGNIYIVDVDEDLMSIIPDEIRGKAVIKTHEYTEWDGDACAFARKQYDEYKNASLVITSLLHCSSPCIGMGIPVVVLKKNLSYRFGWIDKIIPIYTEKDIGNIDWHPGAVDVKTLKKTMVEIATERLWYSFNHYKKRLDLSYYFEDYGERDYPIDSCMALKEYIDKNWSKNQCYEYSLYGLTQISEWTYDYINENYSAKLNHVYDKYRELDFYGFTSESPDNIPINSSDIFFITSPGAFEDAKIILRRKGVKDCNIVFALPQR